MNSFSFVILYVDDVAKSTAFYADLTGLTPETVSPGFSIFSMANGQQFGLWAKTAAGALAAPAGGAEYCFAVTSDQELEDTHKSWKGMGVTIAEAPSRAPFGLTFVANDPDGHHIRVFAPAA